MTLLANNSALAARLTPDAQATPEALRQKYPPRQLPEGARVTRVGPSPTGFMHIGGIYAALVSERMAQQSGGVFFLRIEDTDKKREVEGAVELIVQSLQRYGIRVDEGEVAIGDERGAYGPYRQSERKAIYQSFARALIEAGKVYPCFATNEELEAMRQEQARVKAPPGYYGHWAIWRDRPQADVERALEAGTPLVLRTRAAGGITKRKSIDDLVRGELSFPENDKDIVLIKSDGLPTYHFAHVIDDHLMGTTDVIRGHEWLGTLPVHVQLFEDLGWRLPRYAHISPIEKSEGGSRRKLSKRADPEASVAFYDEQGFPEESVIDYLLNLADSRFEEWRTENPDVDSRAFSLDITRMNRSGALFDLTKLSSIARDTIARLSPADIFARGLAWAERHDPELAAEMRAAPDYATAALGIERASGRVRKDIGKWSDLRHELGYFFDALFAGQAEERTALLPDRATYAEFLEEVAASYDDSVDRDAWLAWLRGISARHGYAENNKAFKANPGQFKGHFGDVTGAVRILLTGRKQSPDLFEIMAVMGQERVAARLRAS